ncbi:glycosyltransferase [Proteiniphilum sp.]|uniref:glycosyltransferase n=1 Tax=Proteiniphilum sp. TaxID=1926877 RepID=UPI0033322427
MKLIINTSNIVVGGGIQVSLSFIEELRKFKGNEYHLFLSQAVARQIEENEYPDNFKFYHFNCSPASIAKGYKIRQRLNYLENKIKPDLVFTVFGPAYWKPKSIHVSGFANGWCYNPNSIAFRCLSLKRRINSRLSRIIKNHKIKKADFLIVETEDAKYKINKFLHIPTSEIFVVGNTYHPVYAKYRNKLENGENLVDKTFRLLVLSAFYPHKNLEIINNVIPLLKEKSEKKFTFYLTIKEEDFKNNFSKSEYIINLGPQKIENCPELYNKSDALFLPTLLETFSANYPEAMIMRKPILTSDLDFAKDICRDAALYFDPLNPEDIANKIIQLTEDKELYTSLVENGKKQILDFETSESRAEKYMSLFAEIISIGIGL